MKIGHIKGGQRLVSNITDRISQISLWKADWRVRLKKTLGGAQLSSQTAENTYETDEKPVISEKLIILGIQRTTKP